MLGLVNSSLAFGEFGVGVEERKKRERRNSEDVWYLES